MSIMRIALGGASTIALATIAAPAVANGDADQPAVGAATNVAHIDQGLPILLTSAADASSPGGSESDTIIVVGQRDLKLDEQTDTGSRLGLTNRETPATIDVVTQATMQAKGLRTAVEVYDSVPGVVAGILPGEPGNASVRGFSTGAISYLMDGIRITDSTLVARNLDSFNFARIEVLKGPASVLYGEGALAGAINLVPKKPSFDQATGDVLASYGSFNAARLGAGVNLPIAPKTAVRTDLSVARSDGYVDDTGWKTIQSTSSLRSEPFERLSVLLAFDYYGDRYRTPYQGAPLVPLSVARNPSGEVRAANGFVLDEAMRDENYNVSDGRQLSDAYWGRARIQYELAGTWRLINEFSYYHADREWENSEDYTYNGATGLLNRSTTKILHDQDFWSNRTFLSGEFSIGGLRNRMSVGAEYNATDFQSVRRFGTTSPVTLFDPVRGTFPADTPANFPGAGNRANFDSEVKSWAIFGEDALNISAKWLVVGGLRFDHIELDRRIDDLNAGTSTLFGRSFKALSGRIGTIYDLAPKIQVYAQYSHAVTPVGAFTLTNVLRASVDLTSGDSIEAGVKATLFGDRLTMTAAGYWIRQKNILTRDPANPGLQIQGGIQSSRGVELSAAAAITRNLHVEGNFALLKAKFDELTGPGGVDFSGNRPVNVPNHTANLSVAYHFDVAPVTIGASARHVGSITTSTANTVRADGYTTFEASLSYRFRKATITLRGRNLADKFYAYWSGYSATQLFVAAPRSVDITVTTSF